MKKILIFITLLFIALSVYSQSGTTMSIKRIDSTAYIPSSAVKSILVINENGASRQLDRFTAKNYFSAPVYSYPFAVPSTGACDWKNAFVKEGGSIITAYVDSSCVRHAVSQDLSDYILASKLRSDSTTLANNINYVRGISDTRDDSLKSALSRKADTSSMNGKIPITADEHTFKGTSAWTSLSLTNTSNNTTYIGANNSKLQFELPLSGMWYSFIVGSAAVAFIDDRGLILNPNGTKRRVMGLYPYPPAADDAVPRSYVDSISTRIGTVQGYVLKSVSATLTIEEAGTIETINSITLTLPSASSAFRKMYTIIKDSGTSNTVTVSAASGETINNSSNINLTAAYETITIQSNGSKWLRLK